MKIFTYLILFSLIAFTGCNESTSILAPESEEEIQLEGYKVKYSRNYTVNGDQGGVLFLKVSWLNEDSTRVALESKLTIPKGAYKGDLTFDMIFDLENYALELYPSPFTFDLPVLLDMKFTKIDLTDIDLANFNFTYLDGEEEIEYKRIRTNEAEGSIAVYGAVLDHFSRYGWTRTTTVK